MVIFAIMAEIKVMGLGWEWEWEVIKDELVQIQLDYTIYYKLYVIEFN